MDGHDMRLPASEAGTLANELQKLEIAGKLDPETIVQTASDESHPLHKFFEWNNDEAARLYRLEQARMLIRRVKLTVEINDTPIVLPRYIRDPEAETGDKAYTHVSVIANDEGKKRKVIIDEMTRVVAAVRRAKTIAHVFGTVEDVRKIEEIALSVIDKAALNPELSSRAVN